MTTQVTASSVRRHGSRPALVSLAAGFLALVGTALPGIASAQVSTRDQLAVIARLLPPAAAESAELILPLPTGDVVGREGSGDWICRGDSAGDDQLSLNCYTRSMAAVLDRQRQLQGQGMESDAVREQIDREARSGQLSLPQAGAEIYASGPLSPDGGLPETLSVYHLVYVPFATSESIGVSDLEPDDPAVPFLHHAGTHEAHVMWSETVPLAAPSDRERGR